MRFVGWIAGGLASVVALSAGTTTAHAVAGYKFRQIQAPDVVRPQIAEARLSPTPSKLPNILTTYTGTILLSPPIKYQDGGETGQADACSRWELVLELPQPAGATPHRGWTDNRSARSDATTSWALFGAGAAHGNVAAVVKSDLGHSPGPGPHNVPDWLSWAIDDAWVEIGDALGDADHPGAGRALYLHLLVVSCAENTTVLRVGYQATVLGTELPK